MLGANVMVAICGMTNHTYDFMLLPNEDLRCLTVNILPIFAYFEKQCLGFLFGL
jgi:hypothetical protein